MNTIRVEDRMGNVSDLVLANICEIAWSEQWASVHTNGTEVLVSLATAERILEALKND